MSLDPAQSNPNHYKVVFENDSVMYTASSFRRRLYSGDSHRDVDMPAGLTGWLPAQQHYGENIGDTPLDAGALLAHLPPNVSAGLTVRSSSTTRRLSLSARA